MNTTIENNISRIAEEARGRYFALLDDARAQTVRAAGAVSKVKGPVKTASRFGLKLTATSHKTADKVLKQQTRLVEHQIDAFAGRLRAAAAATDLRDLVGTQLRLIPQNASLYVDDMRETVNILTGAGQEVGAIVKDTVQELRGRKPVAKKAAKKAPKKAAKKTAKKAAKKAAAKKSAPKRAARTAPTKAAPIVATPALKTTDDKKAA